MFAQTLTAAAIVGVFAAFMYRPAPGEKQAALKAVRAGLIALAVAFAAFFGVLLLWPACGSQRGGGGGVGGLEAALSEAYGGAPDF
jgi:hypothetical protein